MEDSPEHCLLYLTHMVVYMESRGNERTMVGLATIDGGEVHEDTYCLFIWKWLDGGRRRRPEPSAEGIYHLCQLSQCWHNYAYRGTPRFVLLLRKLPNEHEHFERIGMGICFDDMWAEERESSRLYDCLIQTRTLLCFLLSVLGFPESSGPFYSLTDTGSLGID